MKKNVLINFILLTDNASRYLVNQLDVIVERWPK